MTTIDMMVDPGVAVAVALRMFAADYATRPSLGSREGTHYRTASGNMIANLGEKRIRMRTEGGGARAMTFQVIDVTKPLASAPNSRSLPNMNDSRTQSQSGSSRPPRADFGPRAVR